MREVESLTTTICVKHLHESGDIILDWLTDGK